MVSPPAWWALTPPSHPYLTVVGRLFSSAFPLPSPTPCTLTSGMLSVARTFLILHAEQATDRPTAFYDAKLHFLFVNANTLSYKEQLTILRQWPQAVIDHLFEVVNV